MQTCASCGQENPDGFRLCGMCGATLAPAAPAGEQRKVVTVVFCDVTGSTALGEELDPESLRHVMARYFAETSAVIERHGGTVEKFIGDAVMAVFGVPRVHEDDALRAVRSAAELRARLAVLNDELERDYGTRLALRIGVNTGEVVTGTQERLATGDAVNVAARLEQAAEPGEILLGGETLRLVRGAVAAVPAGPLELKGKREPVETHRLLAVESEAPARRLDTQLVGRVRERRLLADAWERAVSESSCHLFSLLGTAGVGKSRLAADFLDGLDATVLRGRCLPYGEGITYWPVVEIVKQLLEPEPDAELGELVTDPAARVAIEALLGDAEQPTSPEEIAWATRKLLERAAARRPLAVVLEDVHWGEPTFLDLVEHVADLSRGAPILVLCLARPELLDRREGWAGGKLNATTVLLEPLSGEETELLIDRLVGSAPLTPELRSRIRSTADGNPLFVEEMLAMVRERGEVEIRVPPTIQALLAARLDLLDPSERRVLERGAVEGQSFHRGTVQALAPEEPEVPAKLMRLVRKELVRPEPPALPDEDAFRFRHLLIRDAAYDALPKATRAELHERFAAWLDERGESLVERDEIVGYHLEQAYRYRTELGPADERAEALAEGAAERLEAAGRRAFDRGDVGAVDNLLQRAGVLRGGRMTVGLELMRVVALFMGGRPADAVALAGDAAERPRAAGDEVGALCADLLRTELLTHIDTQCGFDELQALVDRARPLFEDARDDEALAYLWREIGWIEHNRCRWSAALAACERMTEHARAAGNHQLERLAGISAAAAAALGPMPAHETIEWLDAARERLPGNLWADEWKATMLAGLGRFDEARALHDLVVSRMAERGYGLAVAITAQGGWDIEMLAGDVPAAERIARAGCEQLEQMGERGWLSTQACELGASLLELGRLDEAEEWARRGLELGGADDVFTQMLARQVLARLRARQGAAAEAEELGREAVALGETTESIVHQGDAHVDLAEALALLGRHEEAAEELARAITRYERKGFTASVARAHRRLDALLGEPAPAA